MKEKLNDLERRVDALLNVQRKTITALEQFKEATDINRETMEKMSKLLKDIVDLIGERRKQHEVPRYIG